MKDGDSLPNSLPRPPGELKTLQALWQPPRGWRAFSIVNNTYIGLYYIGAALLFLVLGGILALLMRLQLSLPNNDLLDADRYNQFFTMHGSIMMFLFAVPVVEAISVLLLPAMLGARDLPFPRLSAYAFWAYFIGGLIFFVTLFFDTAPDGGWFMYPPLTGAGHSPGLRTDFWLLGIGFIEISAIAGAIEIIVGVLRTRTPGMTLGKMPVYAWAMLVVGCMIVFAFPPVILATALLELERAFDWPFFIVERGGDPVLWQHLFWLFGHPDVYIIFLPGAGMVSMIVATMARTPLVGYKPVVIAMIATGVISFALWVHHMFAIGMSHHAAMLVSAASLSVAVPTGLQVFAWIATLRQGRVQNATPTWFLLGFFAVFVLGGLTGVMLAVVPYDWQAHDTYFVVAHLHYVAIGGMLFPVFAAIYYWAPVLSGKRLSERMGKWACTLMLIGVNVTFFPMHLLGLFGMPRRVWTYSDTLGWDVLNLISTLGAFVIAAGVLLVLLDLMLHFRIGGKVNTNPWNAGTLEWLPTDHFATRSIPRVVSREPIWDRPTLRDEVDLGQHYLPGSATGGRETIVTSAKDAQPQYLLRLPGPSWLPFIAGAGTAAFFFLLTVKWFVLCGLAGALTLCCILKWLWQCDPPTMHQHDDMGGDAGNDAGNDVGDDIGYEIGDGIRLPDYMAGSRSHSAWAMIVLLLVDGSIFASLAFAHFYLLDASTAASVNSASSHSAWLAGIAGLLVSGAVIMLARRYLPPHGERVTAIGLLLIALAAVWASAFLHLNGLRGANLHPVSNALGATIYAFFAWQILHAVLLTLMAAFVSIRIGVGRLDANRSVIFDNTRLMWLYAVAQGTVALTITIFAG